MHKTDAHLRFGCMRYTYELFHLSDHEQGVFLLVTSGWEGEWEGAGPRIVWFYLRGEKTFMKGLLRWPDYLDLVEELKGEPWPVIKAAFELAVWSIGTQDLVAIARRLVAEREETSRRYRRRVWLSSLWQRLRWWR